MSIKLKPLADRLVVEPIEQEETTASGIILPETAKEKPQQGAVLAVGPGRYGDEDERIPMDVKVGDRVLYAKYTGQDVPRGVLGSEEEEFLVLRESDILAKLG